MWEPEWVMVCRGPPALSCRSPTSAVGSHSPVEALRRPQRPGRCSVPETSSRHSASPTPGLRNAVGTTQAGTPQMTIDELLSSGLGAHVSR